MTDESPKCWICGLHANAYHWNMDNEAITVDCRICGRYRASHEARGIANGSDRALLPYLAAHIRQSAAEGKFEVTTDWPEQARAHANSTLPQKIRLLLEWIAKRTGIAKHIEIDLELLAPFIDAVDWHEVNFLLDHLEGSGFVSTRRIDVPSRDRAPDSPGQRKSVVMTVSGWQAVSPVAGTGIVGTCFIAMSFARDLDDAYDRGMVPAIKEDCGFNVIRVDRVEHNDDITDRILAGIRGAQFVVADFTGQRQGVYFEAGFAAGLGRVVIWTCRADEIDNLHFDTRQRNHIVWTGPADLREKLAQRIRATVTLPARLG
jgi:hypothetical protein